MKNESTNGRSAANNEPSREVGYTDTSGNPAANATLSAARAQETRDFLMDVLQLEPSKILAVGRQHGVTKFGRPAENRVVEVRVFVLGVPPVGLATDSPLH